MDCSAPKSMNTTYRHAQTISYAGSAKQTQTSNSFQQINPRTRSPPPDLRNVAGLPGPVGPKPASWKLPPPASDFRPLLPPPHSVHSVHSVVKLPKSNPFNHRLHRLIPERHQRSPGGARFVVTCLRRSTLTTECTECTEFKPPILKPF